MGGGYQMTSINKHVTDTDKCDCFLQIKSSLSNCMPCSLDTNLACKTEANKPDRLVKLTFARLLLILLANKQENLEARSTGNAKEWALRGASERKIKKAKEKEEGRGADCCWGKYAMSAKGIRGPVMKVLLSKRCYVSLHACTCKGPAQHSSLTQNVTAPEEGWKKKRACLKGNIPCCKLSGCGKVTAQQHPRNNTQTQFVFVSDHKSIKGFQETTSKKKKRRGGWGGRADRISWLLHHARIVTRMLLALHWCWWYKV